MSITYVKMIPDKHAETLSAEEAYYRLKKAPQKMCFCDYCLVPGAVVCRKGTFYFRCSNGSVHNDPICIKLHGEKRCVSYKNIDMKKILDNMHRERTKKKGGHREGDPHEIREPDENGEEVEMQLFSPAAFVKNLFYERTALDIGNGRDIVEFYINQYNAERLNGNYLNMTERFIAAEPFDFHTLGKCIQFRLPFVANDRKTKLMINMYFDDEALFRKMRDKLFFKKRNKDHKHNYPKYTLVQIFGDRWNYVQSFSGNCGDYCKLYRNNCAFCKYLNENCDGLLYTNAMTSKYVEMIPKFRLDYAEAKALVDNRKNTAR